MTAPDNGDDGPRRRPGRRQSDLPFGERIRSLILKPAEPDSSAKSTADQLTLEELQTVERYADDKERFLGLIAAPLAAAIGFLVANYLIDHDPPAYLKSGQVNRLHASIATYHALEFVLLGLSLAMLATAWYRKRLFLGIAMALYGLGIFNLHYWGFGVPFLAAGSWLLVRAYRAHQAVKGATPQDRGSSGARPSGLARPRANKRYTPPA